MVKVNTDCQETVLGEHLQPLLSLGVWQLASGRYSRLKLECDTLTDDDWRNAAFLLSHMLGRDPFSEVVGVPNGGLALAKYMQEYTSPEGPTLVVDDVWTTGGSMKRFIKDNFKDYSKPQPLQAVLFARGLRPPWVRALFTLDQAVWDL